MSLLLLTACASVDADFDGISPPEDCDDQEPFVYPGAPDDPADGVDADCDGEDPPYAFIGAWPVRSVSASYSGFDFLEPDGASGELTVGGDLGSSFALEATLVAELYGAPVPFTLLLEGQASPVEGPDTFVIAADGEQYGETMHIDWDCARFVEDAVVVCEGELKAFEISLDVYAEFDG